MKLKAGVRVLGLSTPMILAAIVADTVYHEVAGVSAVITSGIDGSHSRGSKHYAGDAIDLRINHVAPEKHPILVSELKSALTADYDVVFEDDHIHIEFDPKDAY